jgi:hypothetical protein
MAAAEGRGRREAAYEAARRLDALALGGCGGSVLD